DAPIPLTIRCDAPTNCLLGVLRHFAELLVGKELGSKLLGNEVRVLDAKHGNSSFASGRNGRCRWGIATVASGGGSGDRAPSAGPRRAYHHACMRPHRSETLLTA